MGIHGDNSAASEAQDRQRRLGVRPRERSRSSRAGGDRHENSAQYNPPPRRFVLRPDFFGISRTGAVYQVTDVVDAEAEGEMPVDRAAEIDFPGMRTDKEPPHPSAPPVDAALLPSHPPTGRDPNISGYTRKSAVRRNRSRLSSLGH